MSKKSKAIIELMKLWIKMGWDIIFEPVKQKIQLVLKSLKTLRCD